MICMYYKMEARFDTATMFSLSIILLVFPAVDVIADVPDGVVYTDVRKIAIRGDDAVLKCQFLGTPIAVYWKKGSDPESAPNLITWVKDLPPTGSCVEDGACEMADDFSLILKEVGMEDQGRYICRVVNYRGILIHNFTNVKVIDPDELSIHTEPFVMGWAGSAVNLPCNFAIEPQKVLWKRIYGDGGSTVETLLNYTSDGHDAPGTGRYSWSKNFGLVIRDLHVSDEGNFTCLVSTIAGIEIKNSTVLVVNGPIVKDPAVITLLIMATIQCFLGLVFVFLISCRAIATNKIFILTIMIGFLLGVVIVSSFILMCIRRSIATNLMPIWMIIIEYILGVVFLSLSIVMCIRRSVVTDKIFIFTIMIGFLLGVVIVSLFILMCIRRSIATDQMPIGIIMIECFLVVMIVSSSIVMCIRRSIDCFRRVFRQNIPDSRNADTELEADIKLQRLMEQERKLDNLRENLKKYRPGEATDIQNTKRFPRVINLGVYGVKGVGKSSLINSLSFALKSTFENVISRVSDGGEVEFADRIHVRLTKHITILDNIGMKDLSERQITDSLIPRIRGERGVDSDNGVVTHCPIFVHDIRKPLDPMCIFVKQFSSAVHEHYGQNVVVVFTHTDTVDNLDDYINRTHTYIGIPEENIWSFENYTENNNNEDVERSIQYLEFLQKCLEIGEKNHLNCFHKVAVEDEVVGTL